MLTPTGGTPVECTVPIADLSGGVFAAMATCAALLGRTRTGSGERIDVAMAEVLATWTGPFTGTAVAGQREPMGKLPSYGSFASADGQWITLGVIDEQHFWARLCGDARAGGPHATASFSPVWNESRRARPAGLGGHRRPGP